jgi:outer membrane protein assembly factor BamA
MAEQVGSLRLLPIFTIAPETGVSLGVAAVQVVRPGADTITRPSTNQSVFVITQKKQWRLYFERERWLTGNRWHYDAIASFSHFPQPFYGVVASPPTDPVEYYTPDTFVAYFGLDRRLAEGVYFGMAYRGIRTHVVHTEPGGALVSSALLGRGGGTLSAIEQTLAYDTRDNVFGARRGTYVALIHQGGMKAIGSDFNMDDWKLDARYFIPVRTEHVLALQGTYERAGGGVPFDLLPSMGGSNVMRGYVTGQYRGRQVMTAQAEARAATFGRFGVVGFAGGAKVCGATCAESSSGFVPSWGFGVRWYLVPTERVTIRIDQGYGRGSRGFYFDFTEAF